MSNLMLKRYTLPPMFLIWSSHAIYSGNKAKTNKM